MGDEGVEGDFGCSVHHQGLSREHKSEEFLAVFARNIGQREIQGAVGGRHLAWFGFWETGHLSEHGASASNVGPNRVNAIGQAEVEALLHRRIVSLIPSVCVERLACGQHRESEGCREGVVVQDVLHVRQVVQGASRTPTTATATASTRATGGASRERWAVVFVLVGTGCFHLMQGEKQDALPRFLKEFELVLPGGQSHALRRPHRATEAR